MVATPVFFGSGSLIMTRTDVANSTPSTVGVLQDVQLDFDFTNKDLIGQYQFPVDVARAQGKIVGKAKFAQIFGRTINDMFFGQTLSSTGGILAKINESGTVPGSSTYTIAVTNSATWLADQGVTYATTGTPLVQVASAPTIGQYSCAAGVYTFSSSDASASVYTSYTYSSTTNKQISGVNQLMGTSPVFEVLLAETYKSNVLNFKLYNAIATKLSFPFKNTDYSIQDLEFSAYANTAGKVFEITTSQ